MIDYMYEERTSDPRTNECLQRQLSPSRVIIWRQLALVQKSPLRHTLSVSQPGDID